MDLLLLTDALKRETDYKAPKLVMPYLPYARQDRVCNSGEAFSLKVFTDLINSQGYSSVTVWDCHSDVGIALLDRCINVSQVKLISKDVPTFEKVKILVSPDAGANKKVQAVAKALPENFTRIIRADKVRDCATGEITDTVVYCHDLEGQNVLILDDIFDGGRTFIELGKKLKEKNAGKVILYVTHGIFNYGVDVVQGAIDEIYCPNIWRENVAGRNNLQILRTMDGGVCTPNN